MPTLKIQKKRFHALMEKEYTFQELEDLGFEFGIEIEEEVETFENPHQAPVENYKFDCSNNRPDLLSEASLTRILKMYLRKITCPEVKVLPAREKIIVDSSVEQIRPFVVGAVLRDITFTPETYKAFINFQDKLHVTLCRNRTMASMGTHDLDKAKGPFKYVAQAPDSFKFVALNQEVPVDGNGLIASLENHKLKEYLPLIKNSPVFPLILDSTGEVCSLPPIINSEYSKISEETKNVFIEITATSKPKALVSLNTLIWGFSEYCKEPFTVEAVDIVYGDNVETTPEWKSRSWSVSHDRCDRMIGSKLNSAEIISGFERMGHKFISEEHGIYHVESPAWRSDVIHEVDLLEDVAICYGFQNIEAILPPSQTIGSQQRLSKFSDFVRQEMAGCQFNQALNYALCSRPQMTTMINLVDESKLITLGNAKTKQFQTGRITLISGLLKNIIENKSNPLPYRYFEVGDCIIMDESVEEGAVNVKKLAGLITDEVRENKSKSLFSNIHGTLDLIFKKVHPPKNPEAKPYELRPSTSDLFLPNQQAQVFVDDKRIGMLGIIHPKVLINFKWTHPVAAFELDLEPLEQRFFSTRE